MIGWWTLFLLGEAQGHPFGNRYAAHRLDIAVEAERITVKYTADVPDGLWRSRPEVAAEVQAKAMAEELGSAIIVSLDEVSNPGEVTAEIAPGSDHSTWFQISRSIPLTTSEGHLEVGNANLPEIPAYFATDLVVGPGVSVVSASTLTTSRHGRAIDHNGDWRADEAWRSFEADFTVRRGVGGALVELLHPSTPLRKAALARPQGLMAALWGGGPTWWVGAGFVALILGSAGGLVWRRRYRPAA